ncbi:MAG: A24 family peptidase [Anaerocolumna sp.]
MTCLVCLLLLAVIMDLKSYKISNYLIIFGLISGILFNFYEYGWASVSNSFFGILLPILLLFSLFIIKALGAGDIKLFSVVGSFYGITYVFKSIVAAFIIGAAMSLIYLIKYRLVFYRLHHLATYIQFIISIYPRQGVFEKNIVQSSELNKLQDTQLGIKKKIEPYYDRKRDGNQGAIHFSVAIFGAVLAQIFFDFIRFLKIF